MSAVACKKAAQRTGSGKVIEDCSTAIKLDPKYTKAWQRLGAAQVAKQDFHAATKTYKEVVRLDPKNKSAKAELASFPKRIADQEAKRHKQFRPLEHMGDKTQMRKGKSGKAMHRVEIEDIGSSDDECEDQAPGSASGDAPQAKNNLIMEVPEPVTTASAAKQPATTTSAAATAATAATTTTPTGATATDPAKPAATKIDPPTNAAGAKPSPAHAAQALPDSTPLAKAKSPRKRPAPAAKATKPDPVNLGLFCAKPIIQNLHIHCVSSPCCCVPRVHVDVHVPALSWCLVFAFGLPLCGSCFALRSTLPLPNLRCWLCVHAPICSCGAS